MASILQFDAITRSFFGVAVLRGVSFSLEHGHVLGMVGENGAGKSTLMNILGGVLTADSGTISLNGKQLALRNPQQATENGIAFIHQELNLFPNLSIAENLFIPGFPVRSVLGIPLLHRREMQRRAQELLEMVGLGLSPEVIVDDLAPGERQLLEIAKALSVDARILILDEPTSSLTRREAGQLFSLIERLRAQGMSMIYISHVLGDVLRLCDDICVLRDGEVVACAPKDKFSQDTMISLMTGHEFEELYPSRESCVSSETILKVERVSEPGVVRDVSLTVHKGEVLGLFGLMGSGRTELARMIFGLDTYARGSVTVNGMLDGAPSPRQRIEQRMAFLTEDRREEGLLMGASAGANIAQVALPAFAGRGVIDLKRLDEAASTIGRSVGLSSQALRARDVRSLSGGNQQKVVLSKWFLAKPKLLILDEPTRGVDVKAKYEIYQLINQFVAEGGAVLLISSETEELLGMSDRILVMRNGEMRDELSRAGFDSERMLRAAFGAERVPGVIQ